MHKNCGRILLRVTRLTFAIFQSSFYYYYGIVTLLQLLCYELEE